MVVRFSFFSFRFRVPFSPVVSPPFAPLCSYAPSLSFAWPSFVPGVVCSVLTNTETGTHFNFIREIPIGSPFEIRMKMVGWDRKWVCPPLPSLSPSSLIMRAGICGGTIRHPSQEIRREERRWREEERRGGEGEYVWNPEFNGDSFYTYGFSYASSFFLHPLLFYRHHLNSGRRIQLSLHHL